MIVYADHPTINQILQKGEFDEYLQNPAPRGAFFVATGIFIVFLPLTPQHSSGLSFALHVPRGTPTISEEYRKTPQVTGTDDP